MLCVLIMAGGKGTRFWPLSTEEKPKQFLNLIGNESMIQMTVNRVRSFVPIERIFICTGEKYAELVKKQIPEISDKNIIIEPEGRNTAPCIALSSFIIKRFYKNATMLVLPSDHLIRDEELFRKTILYSKNYLEENPKAILTLGMSPNRPETGYGYIKFIEGKVSAKFNKVMKVKKFVEKPSFKVANNYLKDGSYLWNSGMFIWTVDNIITQIKKFTPNIYEIIKEIEFISEDELKAYINQNYHKLENISIDYAILEKSNDIYVIPSDIGWDDIGTWKAIERYKEKDIYNNILTEGVKAIDSKSNITINNKKRILMIGIENTMIVETEEALFIVNKKFMDNLKEYKEVLPNL